MVSEITNVFPSKLPKLRPEREIVFTIDLVLGTSPVSNTPRHMASVKLVEYRASLDDLLSKGLVRQSMLPWRVPVLFDEKHDGSLCRWVDEKQLNKVIIKNRHP